MNLVERKTEFHHHTASERDVKLRDRLLEGIAIPAHPLALDENRALDERHQRGLSRYYLAAGAGGLAVGVHTTQFEIHDAKIGWYRPVLELAAEEAERFSRAGGERPAMERPVMIAGIVGSTDQALREAADARDIGYDCGLLSLAALGDASDDALIEHARAVAEVLPLFGFYLQPAVGGRVLTYAFWRRLAEIERLVAIKIAPFDRYQTLDVVRAVADAGRIGEVALYTGNDDNIIVDLLTKYPARHPHNSDGVHIAGGLLGHWAVWTKTAVELLEEVKVARQRESIPSTLLTRAVEVTDANSAFFDPQHGFAGSIAGIHEVLRRQGLLANRHTLNPAEGLSPGQLAEIDRVYAAYPHLNDDEFVATHLDDWLSI